MDWDNIDAFLSYPTLFTTAPGQKLMENVTLMHSRNKIEIIPFKKKEFDFFTFIEFVNMTLLHFFAIPVTQQKDHTAQIYVYDNDLKTQSIREDSKYTFHIKLFPKLSCIKVYIKYHLSSFRFGGFDGKPYILLKDDKRCDFTEKEAFYFYRFTQNTLFHQLSKYFTSKNATCTNECVKAFFQRFDPASTSAPMFKFQTMHEVLSCCPGLIKITYQTKVQDKSYTVNIPMQALDHEDFKDETNSRNKIDMRNSGCTKDDEERIDEKGENKGNDAIEDDNEKNEDNDNKENDAIENDNENVEEDDEEEEEEEEADDGEDDGEDDCEEEESKTEEVDILPDELNSNAENAENQKQTLELQTLSIVFPWAEQLIEKVNYIELDASFEGLKPYVYCVSQAIFNNESVPLSITVAPSENHILYENFFTGMNAITKSIIDWSDKVILSDMGRAIKKACNSFNAKQCYCHRHIIEHFGSHSGLGLFVIRLLLCYSELNYNHIRGEINQELNNYVAERKVLKTYTKKFIKKEKDLRIMLSYKNASPKNNFYYKKWALWVRQDNHVARCSNHAEGFHAVVNKSLGSKRSFVSKLKNLIDRSIDHASLFTTRKGGSLRRKRQKIIDKIISKLANKDFEIMSLCKECCNCGEDVFSSFLYGSDISCSHQIFFKIKDNLNMVHDLISSSGQEMTLNQMITLILERIKKSGWSRSSIEYALEEIFGNCLDKIKIDKTTVFNLAVSIHECLNFSKPEFPEFSMQWSIHEIREVYSEKSMTFTKKKRNFIPQQFTFSKEQEAFWTKDCVTENQKYAKKCLFETINEALYIYPEIDDQGKIYSICIDQYMEYIDYKNDLAILESIPRFKISCWKAIDNHMKNNKFFN